MVDEVCFIIFNPSSDDHIHGDVSWTPTLHLCGQLSVSFERFMIPHEIPYLYPENVLGSKLNSVVENLLLQQLLEINVYCSKLDSNLYVDLTTQVFWL